MKITEFNGSDKIPRLKKFAKWCRQRLDLDYLPEIEFSSDFDQVQQHRTFGRAQADGPIWVYVGNRNTADICRTLCHELIHAKQFEQQLAYTGMDADTEQGVEDVANAMAGRMMRQYGKKNPEIYEAHIKPVRPSVAAAMPAAYSITSLPNHDGYMQYRFGVAIASAKGAEHRRQDNVPEYSDETEFGRHHFVMGYDTDLDKWIIDAMEQVGLDPSTLHRINSGRSHEPTYIHKNTHSPVVPFKGYPRSGSTKVSEAKEVHTGIKPDVSAEYAIPGAHRVAGTADRLYDLLRVMMNVARADGVNSTPAPQESWVGRNNLSVPYTPEEAKMLKQAYDQAGVFWDDAIAPNKMNRSEEQPGIYKTSPVAKAAPDYRKPQR